MVRRRARLTVALALVAALACASAGPRPAPADGSYGAPIQNITPQVLRAKQISDDCEAFHCLPSKLAGEDYHELEIMRMIRAAERQYLDQDRRAKEARAKRRRR